MLMDYNEFLNYCKTDCKKAFHNIQELLKEEECSKCDLAYIIKLNEQSNKNINQGLNTENQNP